MVNNMVLAAGLAIAALGGVAFVFAGGNGRADARRASLQKTDAKANAAATDRATKKKQITDSLKDLERNSQRKGADLATRIAQAGLPIDKRQFYMISVGVGVAVAVLVLIKSSSLPLAGLCGVMAALGLWGIAQHPAALWALNPVYGLRFLASGGLNGFLVLGGVFLCVTGAEALYADMGHFGAGPIRVAWSGVVFPSLLLNYAGQAALALDGAPIDGNIFYRLCPTPLLTPLIALATVATVIASQSIITGAFSMTRQAIQLGWLPRLVIKQTSAEGYGQIYVGAVNWLLMIVALGLTLGFGKSDNLAAAYGIAVSLTMLMTTVLLFIAMREIWGWNALAAGALAGLFLVVDGGFFAANMAKALQGGYVPLLLASAVYGVMWIWHRGSIALHESAIADLTPTATFIATLDSGAVARVPGSAVFLTRAKNDTPPVLAWHVRKNRALHQYVLALTLTVVSTPRVAAAERLTVERVADHYWRAEARYGFMEQPDIPALVAECKAGGAEIDLADVTYYVGHETIVPREDGKGLALWQEEIFAAMARNAARISDYLRLPCDHVVEIGREIEI